MSKVQPTKAQFIDLTEFRARKRVSGAAAAQRSGLHRKSIEQTPPWRAAHAPAIVDRPETANRSNHLIEPAKLRRSLFESEHRLLPTPAPATQPFGVGREAAATNGKRTGRLLKRR